MMILSGATLVLPDRLIDSGTVIIEEGTIASVEAGPVPPPAGATELDLTGHVLVPGFVDVHIHGFNGRDVLEPGGVAAIAAALPRCGVTAFCPTAVASPPATLRAFLSDVRACREAPDPRAARVVGAHLESNFVNPEYRGAQPASCLRLPPRRESAPLAGSGEPGGYDGTAIVREIQQAQPDVAIVTLAPELPGALGLIEEFTDGGIIVSLGHSGATYDEARAAIEAGASHATHLFNRMPPINHRAPGLAGAILEHADVAAEVIADGYHVHPAMVRIAVAAKGRDRVIAITDGTAGAGLPAGTRALLGDRPITVRESAVFLDDGTLAGSVLTMAEAFRRLVEQMAFTLVDATHLCATSPARELRLLGHGVIAEGAVADLVVLDAALRVTRTIIGGVDAWKSPR